MCTATGHCHACSSASLHSSSRPVLPARACTALVTFSAGTSAVLGHPPLAIADEPVSHSKPTARLVQQQHHSSTRHRRRLHRARWRLRWVRERGKRERERERESERARTFPLPLTFSFSWAKVQQLTTRPAQVLLQQRQLQPLRSRLGDPQVSLLQAQALQLLQGHTDSSPVCSICIAIVVIIAGVFGW